VRNEEVVSDLPLLCAFVVISSSPQRRDTLAAIV
jgi:hypothetical protein